MNYDSLTVGPSFFWFHVSTIFMNFMDANRYHVNLINSFLLAKSKISKSLRYCFCPLNKISFRFRCTWICPPSSTWISLFRFNDLRFWCFIPVFFSSLLRLLFCIIIVFDWICLGESNLLSLVIWYGIGIMFNVCSF